MVVENSFDMLREWWNLMALMLSTVPSQFRWRYPHPIDLSLLQHHYRVYLHHVM